MVGPGPSLRPSSHPCPTAPPTLSGHTHPGRPPPILTCPRSTQCTSRRRSSSGTPGTRCTRGGCSPDTRHLVQQEPPASAGSGAQDFSLYSWLTLFAPFHLRCCKRVFSFLWPRELSGKRQLSRRTEASQTPRGRASTVWRQRRGFAFRTPGSNSCVNQDLLPSFGAGSGFSQL